MCSDWGTHVACDVPQLSPGGSEQAKADPPGVLTSPQIAAMTNAIVLLHGLLGCGGN